MLCRFILYLRRFQAVKAGAWYIRVPHLISRTNITMSTAKSRLLDSVGLSVFAILVGACLGCQAAAGSEIRLSAKVVYVDDGDTVVLLNAARQRVNVRLSSIDAPESSHENKEAGRVGQPFSDKSRSYLASMVKGETVDATCFEEDHHHRQVCEIFLRGKSVNQEMVRSGFAWANRSAHGRYLRDKSLPGLEEDARRAKRGLWAGSKPVEPWVWRKACWERSVCVGAE